MLSRSALVKLASYALAFAAGSIAALSIERAAADSKRFRTLDAFAETLSLVRRNYVETVGETALVHGAIRGVLDRLDDHSSFYPPRRYRRLREDTQGEFGGVGIRLREADEDADPPYPVIDEVIDGSPAARNQIAAGARLAAIDGAPTARAGDTARRGPSLHSALRGRPGSEVALEVIETGGQRRTVTLARERVVVPSVESEALGDGVAYLKVRRFQEATARDLAAAIKLLASRARGGFVLDLRDNPGGLFDQAVRSADLFIDRGVIVGVVGRGKAVLERPTASRARTVTRARLVVLVDEGTASAAEIVAGALQDHKRATLVGAKTFGKGSVQTFYGLSDGSGIKITTARYVSPSGRAIDGAGLLPDREVSGFQPEVLVAGQEPRAPTVGDRWPHLDAAVVDRLDADFQLLEAFRLLRRKP